MRIEDWLDKETPLIANKLIDYNKKHIAVEKSIGFTGRDIELPDYDIWTKQFTIKEL